MKFNTTIKLTCSLVILLPLFCLAETGDMQITFKVTDDSGKPIPGVAIGVSFIQTANPFAPTIGNSHKEQNELTTGEDGTAFFSKSSILDQHLYYVIGQIPGYYYNSGGSYTFQSVSNGHWQPLNPTVEIVKMPIGNQVPMYAKQNDGNLTLPATDKPIGYDLMAGDWVAPYGKGLTNDFIFTLKRQFTNVNEDFDAMLVVDFSNEGDGIQSVSMKPHTSLPLPRSASEDGYASQLALRKYQAAGKPIVVTSQEAGKPLEDASNEDQNYFFRVRTVKKDGKIISALYGKIYGSMKFSIYRVSTAEIIFTYYLNPEANSRNMEFNSKSNLFKNLKPLEKVTAP